MALSQVFVMIGRFTAHAKLFVCFTSNGSKSACEKRLVFMKLRPFAVVFTAGLMLLNGCTCSTPKVSNAGTDLNLQAGPSRSLPRAPSAAAYAFYGMEANSKPLKFSPGVPIRLPSACDFSIYGWAIDKANAAPAGGVDIAIDGIAWFAALNMRRDDVAAFFKNPAYAPSGFQFHAHSGDILPGTHMLTVRVIANDHQSYYESSPLTLVVQ